MAVGDSAQAAGYPLVSPTDDKRNGAEEINKTRDIIAQGFANLGSASRWSVDQAAAPGTVPLRNINGTFSTGIATQPEHVVRLQQLSDLEARIDARLKKIGG